MWVGQNLKLAEDLQKRLGTMSKEKQVELFEHLKIELLKMGVEYNMIFDPAHKNIKAIEFIHVYIYPNSNAKAEFFNHFFLVKRASLIVSELPYL